MSDHDRDGYRRDDVRARDHHGRDDHAHAVIMGMDVELHPFDARFLFAGAVQMKIVQVQPGEFTFELIERHAQVQQSADEHIAADPAENIQIQRFHFTSEHPAARALIWLAA